MKIAFLAISLGLLFCMSLNAQTQQIPDFGYWTKRVAAFTDFLDNRLPADDRKGWIHGVGIKSYNCKQWTKDDLLIFATAYNSVDHFETLILLKDAAASEPHGSLTAADKRFAQNALEYLRPNLCKSWKSFGNWIMDVENESASQRATLHRRKK